MSGFNVESSIPDIIDEKLKKYDDEDMIWIYNEVLKLPERIDNSSRRHSNGQRRNDRQNLSFRDIEKYKSIDGIKNRIKIKLKEINDREILEYFFIETEKRNDLIDKKNNFTFLKQNKRICSFAVNYLNNKDNRRESDCYFEYTENSYFYIIYHFTFNRTESDNYDLERIKDVNLNTILKSYHNNSKNFEDKDFLIWAYSYLRDKNEDFRKIRFIPEKNYDYQNLIVSFLDYLLYFDKDYHYLLTNQLYKAWSQRKFRAADKIKKPYHLPLTKLAKSELKKLSDFKNKTENEILEELIHQMYLSEMCDEDGKLKY
jgi:hypothetical protein